MGSRFHPRFFKMLAEAYSAETRLAATLAMLHERAMSRDLRILLDRMKRDTQAQLVRVEGILALLDRSSSDEPWHASELLLADACNAVAIEDRSERESAIALSLADIQHLVMLRYHALHLWARSLGLAETSEQLGHCLIEDIEVTRLLISHAHPNMPDRVDPSHPADMTRH